MTLSDSPDPQTLSLASPLPISTAERWCCTTLMATRWHGRRNCCPVGRKGPDESEAKVKLSQGWLVALRWLASFTGTPLLRHVFECLGAWKISRTKWQLCKIPGSPPAVSLLFLLPLDWSSSGPGPSHQCYIYQGSVFTNGPNKRTVREQFMNRACS